MRATHQDAADNWLCPVARTFIPAQPKCRGCNCPLWRWTTGQRHADALKKVAEEIGEKVPSRPKAARIVANDPVAYGLHGYCGLGGGV